MQNFSQRLGVAISSSGKSKGALAADVGVALSTVSRWCGGAVPKAETLEQIAQFLGVDAKWLLTGEDSQRHGSPRERSAETAPPRVSEGNPVATGDEWEIRHLRAENERLRELLGGIRALVNAGLPGGEMRPAVSYRDETKKQKADEA